MATESVRPVAERILELLQHLGVARVHVAGATPGDWRDLAMTAADRVASLSLVCPTAVDATALSAIASRVLVFHGDRGSAAERVRSTVARVPGATLATFTDYPGLPFADIAEERRHEIEPALVEFVQRMEEQVPSTARTPPARTGEVAGLTYQVMGAGPTLLLLPLALAPSQWEPLLPGLSQHFCTIILRGPHLGYLPLLEGRGQAPGYVRVVRNVMEEVALRPGEVILDAGCGSGVVDRWLAEYTRRSHTITAVDVNRYLIEEAAALAQQAGLQNVVTFQEGNAEVLPFPPDQFDVTLSLTVLEEGDADRMLGELVRVTKPGGRVAAIVRGDDYPALFTLSVRPEIHAKAGRAVGAGAVARGCADASLYRRFQSAGLIDVRKFLHLAVYDDAQHVVAQFYQSRILSALSPDEAMEWHTAVAQAEAEGAFVLAASHHCAIGTKP